jgi:phosphoglycolate phosphatase-like HAD superfamily hydrolase
MNRDAGSKIARRPHIKWEDSVWFSDVDDTLIDTAGVSLSASIGIQNMLEPAFGASNAETVRSNFNKLFNLMMAGYRVRSEDDWSRIEGGREAVNEMLDYIKTHQRQVTAEYGHFKKWSREVFIKRAAELAGLEVSPELVHEAADAYWSTLTEKTEVFPDAIALSDSLAVRGRPLFLVTSSDARLKMQPNGQFVYDPAYSEALKRQRIELLKEKGLKFRAISIGDPEDKPHPDFFLKALKLASTELDENVEVSDAIMIGDSFMGDLQTPKEQLNFGLVVLREKDREQTLVDDTSQIVVGNLDEVKQFLA